MVCRLQTIRSGRIAHIAIDTSRFQVRSRCQHHRLAVIRRAGVRFQSFDLTFFHDQLCHLSLTDRQTKAQAQADIAEDGYWGVNQTSDRIIQFATALTGGDPDKIESMREAFKKGYAQAEKTWGGSLPEISQKTYDAVMEKFDKLAADAGLTTEA